MIFKLACLYAMLKETSSRTEPVQICQFHLLADVNSDDVGGAGGDDDDNNNNNNNNNSN
jgi:hypothetical protein